MERKEKGITLIALVITIIVMLILVAVSIRLAVNGGLFSKAGETVKKTDIAKLMEDWTVTKWANYNYDEIATLNGKLTEGETFSDFGSRYPQYRDQFEIEGGELVYVGNNDEVRRYFEELGGIILNRKKLSVFIEVENAYTGDRVSGCKVNLYKMCYRNNEDNLYYLVEELMERYPNANARLFA